MSTGSLAKALEQDHLEVDAILAAFADKPGDAAVLENAIRALRRHIYIEEEFLFKGVPEADPTLTRAITILIREHGNIWDSIDAIEKQQDPDVRSALCEQLAGYLIDHNTKEEQLVYPQVDGVVSAEKGEELRTFLASGELPEGWVCEWAR